MKTREGFVSNSSSASYIVNKYYISEYQMELIKAHKDKVDRDYDVWDIVDLGDVFRFSTPIDNFDMEEYLVEIGVPRDAIQWDKDGLY
jgi:hypothetical protein